MEFFLFQNLAYVMRRINMKAIIELDVPEWQIGQDVTVYFSDTMMQRAKCEPLKEYVHNLMYDIIKAWKELKLKC